MGVEGSKKEKTKSYLMRGHNLTKEKLLVFSILVSFLISLFKDSCSR